MANELSIPYVGEGSVYVMAIRMSDGYVWSTVAADFVEYATEDLANYGIALTQLTGDIFVADIPAEFPENITTRLVYYEQSGVAPTEGDLILSSTVISWSGVSLVPPAEQYDGVYATVAQIKAYKVDGDVALPVNKYTDEEIGGRLLFVERWVESITGDIFYEKTETNKFDGNGESTLFFGQQGVPYPLITATSVQDLNLDGTVNRTYVQNDDFVAYPYYIEIARSSSATVRNTIFRGCKWPIGNKNIEVAGTWGRTACPTEITEAVILLTLEKLYRGCTRVQGTGISQAVWPDFTVTFKGKSQAGDTTGFIEIDRLLQGHINYSNLFMVPQSRERQQWF